jgi:CRP-like cAMP-binding protein
MELIVHLNGKMLHDSPIFRFFSLSFLGELTFALKTETFGIDDIIYEEGTKGDRVLYVTKGSVMFIHKKTATFIGEVGFDSFLGEVSFFTGTSRALTAKSKSFTEALALHLQNFLDLASRHP